MKILPSWYEFDYRPELDTGVSYAQSTNSIQSLLDKLRKNKPAPQTAGPSSLLYYRGLTNPSINDVGPPSITGLSSLLDGLIQFADPRARNQLGQFEPISQGGPDPNAMYKTYGPAAAQRQQGGGGLGIGGEIAAATLAAPVVGAGLKGGELGMQSIIKKIKRAKAARKI
jgi:hypothetical protein